jgi:ABC-type polysaccharide/polyol phosphate export permease
LKKYLKELYKRKDLLIYLVISGLKAQHRNTYLGYIWWILDPLLMGLVYYFLRVVMLGMKGDNIGAFLIIGLVAWKWLTAVLSGSAKSISGKAGIITQVYMPKAIFPVSSVLTQLANFLFSLVAIAAFLVFYRIVPTTYILWLPFIIAIQVMFLTAIGLILAYYTMLVRDIEHVISHFTRFWFYSSPIIWETGRLPERYQFLLNYNPAAFIITSYRNVLMYGTAPLYQNLLITGVISLAVIIYMLYFYNLNEHKLIRAI